MPKKQKCRATNGREFTSIAAAERANHGHMVAEKITPVCKKK